MSHKPSPSRSVLAISVVGLLVVSLLAAAPASVAAQSGNTTTEAACQGNPQMSQTSIALTDSTITTEQGATVEANFRPEPTLPEDCTIIVDLEFSFAESGFQFGGGSNWEQSTTNLVATSFEVSPGEIRDIRAQVYTNGAEPGDEVTVIADYEIWYKGDRENSRQQSGIRKTIDVESPNTPTESGSGQDEATQTPAQTEQNGENTAVESTATPEDDLFTLIADNLGMFMLFTIGLVAVVGLVKREPIVQFITGGN